MKKKKSPGYGLVWIIVWTMALIWFFYSGMFNTRELAGLTTAWAVLVGVTVYFLIQQVKAQKALARSKAQLKTNTPGRNAPCPCGSGKKYKRCCAAT